MHTLGRMRPRLNTIPLFAPDTDQRELTAIVEAHKELRDLADKWQLRQLERTILAAF